MIKLKEKNDIDPLCPNCSNCSKSIEELWFRELRGNFGKRYVYFCSHCKKTLGVSHRKGFFMG